MRSELLFSILSALSFLASALVVPHHAAKGRSQEKTEEERQVDTQKHLHVQCRLYRFPQEYCAEKG